MSHPLFLISGPSGSGKTTIMRTLLGHNEVVSFTTRASRPNEVDGIDYHFITVDDFHRLRASDSLIEWSQYGDNYYGARIDEMGKLAVSPRYFICDVNGMRQFRNLNLYDRTVSIFIYADYDAAEANLRNRGESDVFITKRLATYESELSNRIAYDYVVRNNPGRLADTIDIVRHIIDAEVGR